MPRRSRATEEEFSLFPFLAVLLCTMGTLALVFVLVAQKTGGDDANTEDARAREFDKTVAQTELVTNGEIIDSQDLANALGTRTPKAFADVDSLDGVGQEENDAREEYERALAKTNAASLEDVQNEAESLEWFADELDAIRKQTEEAFNEERERLANAEAALAQLRQRVEIAKKQYDALCEKNNVESQDANALKEKLDAINLEIQNLQTETNELREKAKNAKRSYAIAPYQGKKGTFRRPIYLECSSNGVALMPENVKFNDFDFMLARYPGNPFDSAIRAVAHRYLLQTNGKTENGDAVEPYPLLVVRPGGAEYFYVAVQALASWGDVYGYEFVDEDQTIEYPPSDPQTEKIAQEQANFARNRLQTQLAAAVEEERARERILSITEDARARGEKDERYAQGYGQGVGNNGEISSLQARLGADVRVGAARRQLAANATTQATGTPGQNAPVNTGGGASANDGARIGATYLPLLQTPAPKNYDPLATPTAPPQYVGQYSQFATSPGATSEASQSGADQNNALNSVANAGAFASAVNQSLNSGRPGDAPSQGTRLYVDNAAATAQTSAPNHAPTANAPEYMKNFIDPNQPQPREEASSPIEYGKTLGNTTYAANAKGDATNGTLANASDAAQQRSQQAPRSNKSDMPKGAFSVTEDALRPATSGNERGITLKCAANRFVLPRQPGLRENAVVRAGKDRNRAEFEKELEDAVALCVKSWGAAGRNHYWAPFLRVEVEQGAEEEYRQLVEFCNRQGLGIVRVDAPSERK